MTALKTTRDLPLYVSLAGILRQSIRDQQLGPGHLLGTENGLVRDHQVSRVSVRKATDLLIRDGLIERRPGKGLFVCAATPARPAIARAASQTIQMVCGNLAWPACLQMARGVQSAAREAGTQVQLYDAHGSVETDVEFIRGLADGTSAGAVIVALQSPVFTEALYQLKRSGLPFVLIDPHSRDLDMPSVVSDNLEGGRLAGARLLSQGHERIAFFGDLANATVQDRLAGLRDAVGDAGRPFHRALVMDVRPSDPLVDWSPLVAERTRAALASSTPPTAIFASCDAIARAVVVALAAAGLRVPHDLSVIGFDDDPLAQQVDPPLTTVRQDFPALGRAAVDLLQRMISGGVVTAERTILPVTLVERRSVGPPPEPRD